MQQTTDYEFVEVYCADVAERRHRKFLTEEGPFFERPGKTLAIPKKVCYNIGRKR